MTFTGIFNIVTHQLTPIKIKESEINNMTQEGGPYIDHTGAMIIPFSADQKYHYWNGGQPLLKTLLELNVPVGVWAKHTEEPYPGNVA